MAVPLPTALLLDIDLYSFLPPVSPSNSIAQGHDSCEKNIESTVLNSEV